MPGSLQAGISKVLSGLLYQVHPKPGGKGFFGRLLDHLKKLVGSCMMHLFGKPDYHYLEIRFKGFKTQLLIISAASEAKISPWALPTSMESSHLFNAEIWRFSYKFAPLFNIFVAYRFICFFVLYYGKYKMEIGMDHLFIFDARFACSA